MGTAKVTLPKTYHIFSLQDEALEKAREVLRSLAEKCHLAAKQQDLAGSPSCGEAMPIEVTPPAMGAVMAWEDVLKIPKWQI